MDEEKKVYGSSVVNIPENGSEDATVDGSELFTENNEFPSLFTENNEFTSEEVDSMRDELKADDKGSITEEVSKDALSGITSSQEVDLDGSVNDIINEKEVRGKEISRTGVEMLKQVLGRDPTAEEKEKIASYFETLESDKDFTIEKIEENFPEEVITKIKKVAEDNNKDYNEIIIRYVGKIYDKYKYIVEYFDDVSALNKLSRKLDEKNKELDNNENGEKSDEEVTKSINDAYSSIQDIQSKMSEFIKKWETNKLDDRNKRLKQNYNMDDVDIYLIKEIHDALDSALKFERIYQKIRNTKEQMKIELHRPKESNKVIEDWIDMVRRDPLTLYTLPVNDFWTPEKSREELVNIFYTSLLLDYASRFNDELENANISYSDILSKDSIEDVENMLISEQLADRKLFDEMKEKSYIVLYVIAKTFKYKKIQDETSRRVLSYTLDLISKLSIPENMKLFVDLTNNVYKILKEDK